MFFELLPVVLLILASLFILVKGADYLVEGASDYARLLRVSPILVGLTIVAFGTSLPELILSLFTVLQGSNDISLGNIIGSNIANIGLVLAIATLFVKLKVKSRTLIYEFPFLIVASFLLLILANDQFIFQTNTFILSRFDGLIFLTIFSIFLYYIFKTMKVEQKTVTKQFKEAIPHKNSGLKNWGLIIGGSIALFIGGHLFVNSATNLAILTGMSQAFIGITIAAIGTSLPELISTVVAAWRKHGDLAIGNIVGSNIFNILFVLGITSLVKPITINPALLGYDGVIMVAITLLFLVSTTRGKSLTKTNGIILLSTYIIYIASVAWRF